MRFLVVNGYNATASNAKIFSAFSNLVQDIISHKPELADTDCEFYVRDRNSLDDFLYEPETSNIKIESGLKFDSLDMIFIIASPTSRPWNQNMRKLVTLIRMCVRSKKLLFITSFGTQTLAYLCASNINVHINITNNAGEGCKLVEFPKYTRQALLNGHDDYFLDSATGDLYVYSRVTDEWVPKTNIGIHYRRDAMEYQSIGRFVVKPPTYRPKPSQIDFDTLCTIKKPFLHHWLFKNVRFEFAVILQNTWDIHAITFTNPDKRFVSLADNNQRGPLIIECDNIIGLMFEVEGVRKDTVRILNNFIENGIKVVKYNQSYNSRSITDPKLSYAHSTIENIELVFHTKHKQNTNGNPEELKKQQQKTFMLEYRKLLNTAIQESSKDKIFHVGYSVKKDRLPDFVVQNNIVQKNFKVHREKSFVTRALTKRTETDTQPTSRLRSRDFKPDDPQQNTFQTSDLRETAASPKQQQPIRLTQQHVRKLLHPSLGDEYLGQSRIWVPGFMNHRELEPLRLSDLEPIE